MSTQQQEEQQRSGYDPSDTTFRFVTRPDDITLDDDPDSLRAEMSCGHAVTPQSLTAWCRSLLDQGQYKFTCPALKAGTTMEKCGEEWSYTEMRKLAVLTAEEQAHFEETMAMLAAAEYCEFKTCPGCQSFVERQDLTNLSVHCKICTTQTREVYDFCWQCLRRWQGRAPRADKCDNEGCVNQDVERLAKCNLLTLEEVQNVRVPSMRACPTCGNIVEHNGAGCKNIICNRCQIEFCFSCLKLKPDCLITSSYFLPCADGVADRQTSIPSWVK